MFEIGARPPGGAQKEEPMSESRRDETASWDARQVRQAQENYHAHQSRPRRRRRNPLLAAGGYVIFILLTSAILAGVGWLLAIRPVRL